MSKEFYTEVPFEIEFDGPFYSMLGFFDRLGKVERIVNVSNLLVASTKKPAASKAKRTYQYAANESVVATCLTTTYFSHDLDPAVTPGCQQATGEEIGGHDEADNDNFRLRPGRGFGHGPESQGGSEYPCPDERSKSQTNCSSCAECQSRSAEAG